MSSQKQIARKIRNAQGQSHGVEIGERVYVYKKLKRKKCHKVLYNLAAPFIRIVSTLIEATSIHIGALIQGKTDFEFDKLFEKFDAESLAELIESFPFDQYWTLACNILDDVEIDGLQYGALENHEFFDDKPLEMLKAILKGIEVNYPFLGDMIKSGDSGSNDSSQRSRATKKK